MFYCISRNFAFGGRCVTLVLDQLDFVPPHVWTHKSMSVATQDEGEDEAEVCALCRQKCSTITVCGECKEHSCAECMDAHTCGDRTVC